MFMFGYALVPLYYRLCAALGIEVASPQVLEELRTVAAAPSRPLRVEFDANSHNDVVAMRPAARTVELGTGTAHKIVYEISNLTDAPVTGRAYPSYSPARAGKWVNKVYCFCFDELRLAAGETIEAPVVFVIDRELPEDIGAVALSYSFYPEEAAPAEGHGGHQAH
ncbi:MAG: cytochrome c oxidase assembly protein [Betaproteobacteria bacterium AqS2]|uniref:Cytochrome c oxidase assembly protein CtaG n=1 Tax=Candidatus Amphirhobacter heronislandensis TaxID=1732024 RepID=A0A930UDK6_9GAMM|nr:cytochrome c oxidase assembly protein [Betaproteobacteria bacterium AqS2]